MTISAQIAQQLRHVYLGGNWTVSDLKTHLQDVTWQDAITKVDNFNTIAVLVNHIGYYIKVSTKVFEGGPLEGKDALSFAHPPIESAEDWSRMLDSFWAEMEHYAQLLEKFPDEKLLDPFMDGKYGNIFRNITGIIEHTHYHLGQIVFVKKMLAQRKA